MLGVFLGLINDPKEKGRFEELYNQYKLAIFTAAYGILRDVELAEDAAHEAFFALARNMKKISMKSSLQIRNYLIIIVTNASYKIYNKRKKDLYIENTAGQMSGFEDIETDTESKEAQERLMSLIKELDMKYGDVLILKYFYDLSDKEISESLGISLENVKIRLHRGKILLKAKLTEVNFYDGRTV